MTAADPGLVPVPLGSLDARGCYGISQGQVAAMGTEGLLPYLGAAR
jgi:hypothetical protein